MKREGLIYFTVAFVLLSVAFVNAGSLGIFPQSTTISLHQVCDNCTFVNITTVTFPNGTLLNVNSSMTKLSNDYNFSFSQTNSIGQYFYNTCGDQDGILVCENIDFFINKLGEELTEAKSIIYVLLTIMFFILFVFVLWINIMIPYSNRTNIKNHVVSITKAKYLKLALIPITHGLFNLFMNMLLSISDRLISEFPIYYGMFSFITEVSIRLAWPLFVVILVWFMYNWIRDINLNREIKKFGEAIRQ